MSTTIAISDDVYRELERETGDRSGKQPRLALTDSGPLPGTVEAKPRRRRD